MTQTYQYDGFGNLTAKILNGTTSAIAVNAATNQLTNGYYDANGNMTSGAGATLSYDEANRMITAQEVSGGLEYYGYNTANKRVYRVTSSGQEQITFYGAYGEKMGVYGIQEAPCDYNYNYVSACVSGITPLTTSIWFAGRLIMDSGKAAFQDRVGTNRASGARFYPYGDEITSTANDREKFGTYTRDSYTGLDYADQRFYASTYGRFNTPDPYRKSAKQGNPQSWNRYVYTLGDPINANDPSGLDYCNESGMCYSTEECEAVFGLDPACTAYNNNGDGVFYTSDGDYVDVNASGGAYGGTETVSFDTVSGDQVSVSYNFGRDLSSDPNGGGNAVGPDYNTILSFSYTSNGPTILAGGFIGSALGPAGSFVGSVLGSMCGVGGNVSYVPSTRTAYIGWIATCGAGANAGQGWMVSVVPVPPLQNPSRIASGWSTTVTALPLFGSSGLGNGNTGATWVTSPGSGPAVPGGAFGSRAPISVSVGNNFLGCSPRGCGIQ